MLKSSSWAKVPFSRKEIRRLEDQEDIEISGARSGEVHVRESVILGLDSVNLNAFEAQTARLFQFCPGPRRCSSQFVRRFQQDHDEARPVLSILRVYWIDDLPGVLFFELAYVRRNTERRLILHRAARGSERFRNCPKRTRCGLALELELELGLRPATTSVAGRFGRRRGRF